MVWRNVSCLGVQSGAVGNYYLGFLACTLAPVLFSAVHHAQRAEIRLRYRRQVTRRICRGSHRPPSQVGEPSCHYDEAHIPPRLGSTAPADPSFQYQLCHWYRSLLRISNLPLGWWPRRYSLGLLVHWNDMLCYHGLFLSPPIPGTHRLISHHRSLSVK